jgi:hypothetical protein
MASCKINIAEFWSSGKIENFCTSFISFLDKVLNMWSWPWWVARYC